MNNSFANSTAATANTCDGSIREMIASAQQQQQQQHQKHHANELSSPLPTVINRSFDNVSPRPYISIEGMYVHVYFTLIAYTHKCVPSVTRCLSNFTSSFIKFYCNENDDICKCTEQIPSVNERIDA